MPSEAAIPANAVDGAAVDRVSIDGVSVAREGRTVLRDVTLDLSARRTAIIGANGSGKSTFARLLNGLVAPTSGRVLVHGLDVQRDLRAVRREVGFVFTDPQAQILMPTPAEDLLLSLRDLPRIEARDRIAAILDEHGLAGHADAPVSTLSGG
nr:ATP-binding cassette domain-containing protein [Microbacterium hydrocarbonoxydans]